MSLLFYAKPFLDLGICKEYLMARKTDGNSTPRKKKANQPAAIQPAPTSATPEVHSAEVRPTEVQSAETRNFDVRNNVTPIKVTPINVPPAKKPQATPVDLDNPSLDEEIRHRAYELFLERNGAPGDPTADWFIAEQEVRARYATNQSALAASQRG